MKPVGYMLHKEEGLSGEPGLYYDYIVAENGLFIRPQFPHTRPLNKDDCLYQLGGDQGAPPSRGANRAGEREDTRAPLRPFAGDIDG